MIFLARTKYVNTRPIYKVSLVTIYNVFDHTKSLSYTFNKHHGVNFILLYWL